MLLLAKFKWIVDSDNQLQLLKTNSLKGISLQQLT